MANRSIMHIWSQKKPKVVKLLTIFDADPSVWKTMKGLLSIRTLRSIRKEGTKTKAGFAKIEERRQKQENKFAKRLNSLVDSIDDTYRMILARLKSKNPELYKKFFRKKRK